MVVVCVGTLHKGLARGGGVPIPPAMGAGGKWEVCAFLRHMGHIRGFRQARERRTQNGVVSSDPGE